MRRPTVRKSRRCRFGGGSSCPGMIARALYTAQADITHLPRNSLLVTRKGSEMGTGEELTENQYHYPLRSKYH
jgi:hypothetical protein